MPGEISAENEAGDGPVWAGVGYLAGCESDREY